MTFIRSGKPARPQSHSRRLMKSIRRGSWPINSWAIHSIDCPNDGAAWVS